MLNHAAIDNRRVRQMRRLQAEQDPKQLAHAIAAYYLGMTQYALVLIRVLGSEDDPLDDNRGKCAAQLIADMRRWHLACFGVEPPWRIDNKEAAP